MTGSDTAPPGRPAPGGDPATVTVTVWHNVTRDASGRHTGFCHGFRPGDQMVKVFAYQAPSRGRRPEDIAEDAFAAFNGFPHDDQAASLARQYRDRRLRSLSFPGNWPCCSRSCCVQRRVVWPQIAVEVTGQVHIVTASKHRRECRDD